MKLMIASSKHFSSFQFFTYYQPDNLLYNFTKMFQFCYRLVLRSFLKKVSISAFIFHSLLKSLIQENSNINFINT